MHEISPEAILKRILDKNSLSEPNGQPLYKYRTNDFIIDLSKESLTAYDPKSSKGWAHLFVFYASLIWRKEFMGGYWKWELIEKHLGLSKHIGRTNLMNLTEEGMQFWLRPIRKINEDGNRRLLGSIVAEAGLPNYAFSNNYPMASVITESYKTIISSIASELTHEEVISEKIKVYLPKTLKEDDALKELLLQVVLSLYKLAKDFPLSDKKEPVQYLDQADPKWRENFPISLDLDVAKDFIDSILSEVAKETVARLTLPHIFHEISIKGKNSNIHSYLELPYIQESNKKITVRSFGLQPENLKNIGSSLKLILENTEGEYFDLGFVYYSNNETFRFTQQQRIPLPQSAHLQTWSLVLVNGDSEKYTIQIQGNTSLDNKVPWIFRNKNSRWTYHSDASCNIGNSEAVIVLPSGVDYKVIKGSLLNCLQLNDYQQIFKIHEDLKLELDYSVYNIRLNSVEKAKGTFSLRGTLLNIPTFNDTEIFCGLPNVHCKDENGIYLSTRKLNIQYKNGSQVNWKNYLEEQNIFGKTWIRVNNLDDELIFKRKILILPEKFQIQINGNKELVVENSHDLKVSIVDSINLDASIQRIENGHKIVFSNCDVISNDSTIIEFKHEDGNTLKVKIPIPKENIALSKNGQEIKNHTNLFVEELNGYRLLFFNHKSHNDYFEYELELNDPRSRDESIRLRKRVKVPSYAILRKSLTEFKTEISTLFSYGSLDSSIRFSSKTLRFNIKRFPEKAIYDPLSKVLSFENETIKDAEIKAIRVDKTLCTDNIISLEKNSDSTWSFPESALGNWIIYPGQESKAIFRAIFVPSSLDDTNDQDVNKIHNISKLHNAKFRIKAYENLFDKLATDVQNPFWEELKFLWKQTRHLPIQTFDVWSGLVRSKKGMASAFFLLDSENYQELSLGFGFKSYVFLFDDFVSVLTAYRNYYLSQLDDQTASTILGGLIEKIAEELDLTTNAEKLKRYFKIEASEQPLSLEMLGYLLENTIRGEEGNPGLIGRHTEGWPINESEKIESEFKKLPEEVKTIFPSKLNHYAKSIIYLPAILAFYTTGDNVNPFSSVNQKYHIEEHINFDRDYFKDYFNLFQAIFLERESPKMQEFNHARS